MAQYKFDGKYLKRGGSIVANVNGDKIRKGSGSTTVANIRGNNVRQGSGSRIRGGSARHSRPAVGQSHVRLQKMLFLIVLQIPYRLAVLQLLRQH